jgi:hypothetical protein
MRAIIEGKGPPVPEAGGFRQITVPALGPAAPHPKCLVVFAVYPQYAIVILTNSYPVDANGFILIPVDDPNMPAPMNPRKKLTTAQQRRLAERKRRLDVAMKRRFG